VDPSPPKTSKTPKAQGLVGSLWATNIKVEAPQPQTKKPVEKSDKAQQSRGVENSTENTQPAQARGQPGPSTTQNPQDVGNSTEGPQTNPAPRPQEDDNSTQGPPSNAVQPPQQNDNSTETPTENQSDSSEELSPLVEEKGIFKSRHNPENNAQPSQVKPKGPKGGKGRPDKGPREKPNTAQQPREGNSSTVNTRPNPVQQPRQDGNNTEAPPSNTAQQPQRDDNITEAPQSSPAQQPREAESSTGNTQSTPAEGQPGPAAIEAPQSNPVQQPQENVDNTEAPPSNTVQQPGMAENSTEDQPGPAAGGKRKKRTVDRSKVLGTTKDSESAQKTKKPRWPNEEKKEKAAQRS
jgi:hypothetical protein